MIKRKVILILSIQLSILNVFSCQKYTGIDYFSGKVESNNKVKLEAENKVKLEDQANLEVENKVKSEDQAKLEVENKVKSEDQAKLEAENKVKSEDQAKLEAENKAKAEAQAKIELEKKGLDGFIFVQGGTFQMGDTFGDGQEDEKPVHNVKLDSFYIGKYEVTVEEYRKFVNDTGKNTKGCYYWAENKWELDPNRDYNNPGFNQGERNPVSCVSWKDAIEYCNWLSEKKGLAKAYDSSGNIVNWKSYRLPTEAEWEYAAKGGNKSKGYKYSGSNNIKEVAWYRSNSSNKTHEVGTKASNELEIYDMTGNVWEWCSDWYDEKYYNNSNTINVYNNKLASDPVKRGGSWFYNAFGSRVAERGYYSPTGRSYYIGFRLVRMDP
jgi:sulfatase modifying factor 1